MNYDKQIGLSWTPEIQAAYRQLTDLGEAEYSLGPVQDAAQWILAGVMAGHNETVQDVATRMRMHGRFSGYRTVSLSVLYKRIAKAVDVLRSPDPANALRNIDGSLDH